MKKIMPLFLAVLFTLITFSACGGDIVRLQQSQSASDIPPISSTAASVTQSSSPISQPEISSKDWSEYTFSLADYNISLRLPSGLSIQGSGSDPTLSIDFNSFSYPYWGVEDGFTDKIGNFYMMSMEEETIREVDKNTYEAQSFGSWVTYSFSENHTERTFYHYSDYVSFIDFGGEDWSFFYSPQYAFVLQYWLHPDYVQQGISLMEEIVSTIEIR